MIGLGVWQLQRKVGKEALLARYAAARNLPAAPWPAPLFRRSEVDCPSVTAWRTEGGRNAKGETGWLHIASCANGAAVVVGWSDRPEPPRWQGGIVQGIVAPDRGGVRLVATNAPPGLLPARPPSPEDVPNNHLFYALQWFFFAAAASVIYVLALRRRSR